MLHHIAKFCTKATMAEAESLTGMINLRILGARPFGVRGGYDAL